jgi:hypothetical protein
MTSSGCSSPAHETQMNTASKSNKSHEGESMPEMDTKSFYFEPLTLQNFTADFKL